MDISYIPSLFLYAEIFFMIKSLKDEWKERREIEREEER